MNRGANTYHLKISTSSLNPHELFKINQGISVSERSGLVRLIMEEIPSERGCEVVHSVFVLYRSRLLETTVMLLMDIARAANMGCSCRKNAGRNSNG